MKIWKKIYFTVYIIFFTYKVLHFERLNHEVNAKTEGYETQRSII
jgi:hypothetical protein